MTKSVFRVRARADGSYCNLGTALDLRAAPPLKAALLRALSKQRPLTLNAGKVERLSTACAQLVIAAGTAFEDADLALTVTNPSAAFTESLNELGLKSVLDQWSNET